ncbi:MAG: hypothetical protein ACKESB_00860 [Candidatus Hodgkinia cicadicola]
MSGWQEVWVQYGKVEHHLAATKRLKRVPLEGRKLSALLRQYSLGCYRDCVRSHRPWKDEFGRIMVCDSVDEEVGRIT